MLNKIDCIFSNSCLEIGHTILILYERHIVHYHNIKQLVEILETVEIFKNCNNSTFSKLILNHQLDLQKYVHDNYKYD